MPTKTSVTDINIIDARVLSDLLNNHYIDYTYKQVDYDLTSVVLYEPIFSGYKKHLLFFKKAIFTDIKVEFRFEKSFAVTRSERHSMYSRRKIEFDIEIAVDRENKVIYWKLKDKKEDIVYS